MKIGVYGFNGTLGREILRAKPVRPDTSITAGVGPDGNWGVDVVIGCVGRIPAKAKGPDDYFRGNVMAPYQMAMECKTRGVKFVEISTDCVFGDRDFGPPSHPIGLGNEAPLTPTDTYGISKALGELLVRQEGGVVIRTSFISPPQGLWASLLEAHRKGMAEGRQTEYPAWQNVWWSGSTVHEVASNLVCIVEGSVDMYDLDPGEAYHLATTRPVSKAQVVEHVVRETGLMVWPHRADEPRYSRTLRPNFPLGSVLDMDQEELLKCRPTKS